MIPGAVLAWCGTCRSRQRVMDEYLTDTGDTYSDGAGRTRTYLAQPLECGHDAGDGGPRPYRPRRTSPQHTAALVAQLVELQDKARANGVVSR
jgi:hypothetical protein